MSRRPSRREKQAEETRRDILDAARRLFSARGYQGTAIADIASEAGVAVPTVYTSVGAKPLLLREILDGIDQQAGIAPLVDQLRAETEPRRVLELGTAITRQIAEKSGPLIDILASAAAVDEEMRRAYQGGLQRHRAGASSTVGRLAALGALSPGHSADEATAIVATLTSTEVYRSLHRDFGWTYDRCEQWIAETLASQLLRPRRRSSV